MNWVLESVGVAKLTPAEVSLVTLGVIIYSTIIGVVSDLVRPTAET